MQSLYMNEVQADFKNPFFLCPGIQSELSFIKNICKNNSPVFLSFTYLLKASMEPLFDQTTDRYTFSSPEDAGELSVETSLLLLQ